MSLSEEDLILMNYLLKKKSINKGRLQSSSTGQSTANIVQSTANIVISNNIYHQEVVSFPSTRASETFVAGTREQLKEIVDAIASTAIATTSAPSSTAASSLTTSRLSSLASTLSSTSTITAASPSSTSTTSLASTATAYHVVQADEMAKVSPVVWLSFIYILSTIVLIIIFFFGIYIIITYVVGKQNHQSQSNVLETEMQRNDAEKELNEICDQDHQVTSSTDQAQTPLKVTIVRTIE